MNKKKLFTGLLVLALSAQIAASSTLAQTKTSTIKDNISVVINGVKVQGDGTHWELGKVWVDAKGYANLLGHKYSYNSKKKTIKIDGKTLAVRLYKGKPSVDVNAIAKATGADKVNNLNKSKKIWEAYVLDLPMGAISLEGHKDFMTPGVPGMGSHWGLPNQMPTGPIYGIEKGKLVFIEEMISQDDFVKGKNHVNIGGMKGLPSLSIEHTDIEFVPNGHPGFEIPHFDIHHYFVSHAEHLTFSMPPGGAMVGHQH